MTGRIVSGVEAHALGLVTHISADPLAHARKLAAEMVSRSPDAVAAAKLALQEAWLGTEGKALSSERRWQRRLIGFKNQRVAVERNQTKHDVPYGSRRLGG